LRRFHVVARPSGRCLQGGLGSARHRERRETRAVAKPSRVAWMVPSRCSGPESTVIPPQAGLFRLDISEAARGRFFLIEPQRGGPILAQGGTCGRNSGPLSPRVPPWVWVPTIGSLSPTRFLCWGEGRVRGKICRTPRESIFAPRFAPCPLSQPLPPCVIPHPAGNPFFETPLYDSVQASSNQPGVQALGACLTKCKRVSQAPRLLCL
jgi:hypothetical protein